VSVAAEKKRRGGFFKREFGDPERRTAYYMVLPALLIIMIVAFFPIMYAVVLSLTDSTVVQTGPFVGGANYVEMFQNPDFREGLTNTAVFTVVSVTLEFLIGSASRSPSTRPSGAAASSGRPSSCRGPSRRSSPP
jgi:multiple sugar transport system permease protein